MGNPVCQCAVYGRAAAGGSSYFPGVEPVSSGGHLVGPGLPGLAGMTRPEFLEYASNMGVPVVDYDPAELDEELSAFDA